MTTRITQEAVRALTAPKSFARGRDYYRSGAVSDLVRRGARLTAEVEGSEFEPYEITIHLQDHGVADARCTCPFDGHGYCKHIVAVLLKLSDARTKVIERRPVAERLREMDHAELVGLVEKRLENDQKFETWIEAELATRIATLSPPSTVADRRRTLVDAEPIREQARVVLAKRQRRGRYWDDYLPSGNMEELRRLVEKAIPFIEAGDGRNALRVLEPIAEAFIDDWLNYASGSDEETYELFTDFDRLMAEAVLLGDLAPEERDALAEILEEWQVRLDESGIEESFDTAIHAIQSGWDDPALEAVLTGQSKTWPPTGRADWPDDRLMAVRLRVLDAWGKTEEYLRLARVTGAHNSHAAMLVKLDRVPEAIKYALKTFKNPAESLELATLLRTTLAHLDALTIAEAGLQLSRDETTEVGHSVVPLAQWLRDYAGTMGKDDLALKAAKAAFEHSLSLEDFRAAQSWAGGNWSKVRDNLLAHLARATYAYDRTRIYLSEGLIDEAVRSVGNGRQCSAHDETLMQLAEAARSSHSNWVIQIAPSLASGIMDANDSRPYVLASQWLEKAASAYQAAGQEADWRAYLSDLTNRHRRKYKLRPLLEALACGLNLEALTIDA